MTLPLEPPVPSPVVSTHLERVLLVGLVLWGAGVQLSEGVAVAGALVSLLALLWQVQRARRWGEWRAWAREWAPLVAFVMWGVVVTLAHGPLRSSGAFARHLDWLLVPVAAAAFAGLGPAARRRLAVACAVALLLGCAAAGLQHFGVWPSEELVARLRWAPANARRVYEQVPGAEGRYMGGGLLFHRLKFAHVGGLGVLWAIAVGLYATGARRIAGLAVASAVLVSVLIFPYARASVLALAVGVGVELLSLGRRHRRAALWGGAAFLGALALVLALHGSFRERLATSLTASGSGDRPHLLGAGLAAVRSHPLVGTGIGRFQVGEWASPDATEQVRSHHGKSHNQLLSTAAETGVVGALLFVALVVWLARRMAGAGPTGAVGLAALAYMVVLGVVHDPLFHAEVSLAFALSFGVGLSARSAVRRR